MGGRVTLEIAETYDPAPGTVWIELRSFRTPSFTAPTWRQTVVDETVRYSVEPAQAAAAPDAFGNQVVQERWERPTARLELVRRVTVDTDVPLEPVESRALFPVGRLPSETEPFLAATALVQRDAPEIQELGRRLTAGARTQWQAVTGIVNHVIDHLQYKVEPPAHDALASLRRGIANCQGYSHLTMALLRAAGIPARVAVGVTIAKGWRVGHGQDTLTFKGGQGRHAWIEIYYPDLGWIPYEPQWSHLFVSMYHVRQAVGRDVSDVTGTIRALPKLPEIGETIRGDGTNERFGLRTVSVLRSPRNHAASTAVREPGPVVTPPPPPPMRPPLPPPTPGIRRQDLTRLVEYGNLDFPAALRIFGAPEPAAATGIVQARRTFIVETADYATGAEEFAQAFAVTEPMVLSQISLAMQKFGGRTGELWLEIFEDRARKPGARLGETRRLPVVALVERGGYRWLVFDVAPQQAGLLLQPGRYWAALRWTGDGIFNWYFSLGNAYGEPDDTRSRARNVADWSNILNYRFNFRITGLVKP